MTEPEEVEHRKQDMNTTSTRPFTNLPGNEDFDPNNPRQRMLNVLDAVWAMDALPWSFRIELQDKIRRACSEAWTRGYRTCDNTFREDCI